MADDKADGMLGSFGSGRLIPKHVPPSSASGADDELVAFGRGTMQRIEALLAMHRTDDPVSVRRAMLLEIRADIAALLAWQQPVIPSPASPELHPDFGPCDGFGKDGGCSECGRLTAASTEPSDDCNDDCPTDANGYCRHASPALRTPPDVRAPEGTEPPTIRDLQRINQARSDRWMAGSPGWTKLEIAGELAGECGELANVCKKLRRSELGVPGNKLSYAELIEQACGELGDVFIVTMLVASKLGIDLYDATSEAFNKKSEELGFPERFPEVPR